MILRSACRTVGNLRLGLVVLIALVLAAGVASASGGGFRPGAPGAGDPYFPLDGNGGYDVKHYVLDVDLRPGDRPPRRQGARSRPARRRTCPASTSTSTGSRSSRSRSTAGGRLVARRRRAHRHADRRVCRKHADFTTVVRYDGIPETIETSSAQRLHPHRRRHARRRSAARGRHLVPGERPPERQGGVHVPASPFPRGSRRSPTASSKDKRTKHGWTTWTWDAEGADGVLPHDRDDRRVRSARLPDDGIRYWDAIDPDLFDAHGRAAHRQQFAISQQARAVVQAAGPARSACPPAARTLSFWITRDTEPSWDFVFVEAHTVGRTTGPRCRDLNGHTEPGHRASSARSGSTCTRSSRTTRPPTATAPCSPDRDDGRLVGGERRERRVRAVDGRPVGVRGQERRGVDHLRERRLWCRSPASSSTTSSSPRARARPRSRTTATRSTAGRCPALRAGSAPNPNDWIVGTVADTPPPLGEVVDASFARQPEIIDFLVGHVRPLSLLGGRRHRRRPRRPRVRAREPDPSDLREGLLHRPGAGRQRRRARARPPVVRRQRRRWRGGSTSGSTRASRPTPSGSGANARASGTAQEIFDFFYRPSPTDDPFWSLTIGDPGPDALFDVRRLRPRRDDPARSCGSPSATTTSSGSCGRWAQSREGTTSPPTSSSALAERISGRTSTSCSRRGSSRPVGPPSPRRRRSAARRVRRASVRRASRSA